MSSSLTHFLRRTAAVLSSLLSMLYILKVPIQQISDEIQLAVLHREGLEVIILNMMVFQLSKMVFQIIIEYLRGHLTLKPSLLIEIIIDLLLECHESLILTCNFESHQIFGDQLLGLDFMEELRISNQVPGSFLCILDLLKFDRQNII